MKKYIITSAIMLTLAISLPVVSASALGINPTKSEERMQALDARVTKTAERQSDALARIIQKADQLISVRLTNLQKLLVRVQTDKKISPTDQTSLTSDIQTTVGNLQTLKTKIDADTDEATARADTKSIITSYRIYEIFEPKVRLITIISNLQTASSTVSSLSAQIQTLLDNLKSQGKDTTAAQTALTDVNTQVTSINTTLTTDKTLLSSVTISTTNPQSVFVQVRKDLATVRSDYAKIRSDIATIRATLKLVVKMSPSSASSSAK